MDNEGATSTVQLRHRDALKNSKPGEPLAKAVTVSAAGPFRARRIDRPPQPSTHNAQKSTVRKNNRKGKEEEMHPLALAFKEKSEEYRRHLYSAAVKKIDGNLEALLNKLYESNLQVASSDPVGEGSQTSPLRLTVSAKYQRMVQKLYHPLGSYGYNLQRTKPSGEIERTQTSLLDRFEAFEKHIRAEVEQMKDLQRQWEGVVAEIFQLSIVCLGETDVAALLSTANTDPDASSPASKAESTLFVSAHGSSAKGKGKRKHVSFASPDMMALFPEFLFHASGSQESVATAPDLPLEVVQKFSDEVSVLGKQHSTDLRRLENEHKAWWERKQKQFAYTLMQD